MNSKNLIKKNSEYYSKTKILPYSQFGFHIKHSKIYQIRGIIDKI
ncbi:hypothetical protein FWK35_00021433 [Aphis craccivora]|uniref:Uncharacterized protein n=1 Tax=Aphis craccivora TaxID=307492 RepID=A0A6G0YXB3_APHCR|nr:hypothetical protein FWK35_00021433 [Aphis craccivora]